MSDVRRTLRRAVLPALLLVLVIAAGRAGATEAGGAEHVEYSTLQDQASDTAQEFFPQDYERPPFFTLYNTPLIVVGGLIVLVLVVRYLQFQPKFGREPRGKSRR